jgi:hypothetical protein
MAYSAASQAAPELEPIQPFRNVDDFNLTHMPDLFGDLESPAHFTTGEQQAPAIGEV